MNIITRVTNNVFSSHSTLRPLFLGTFWLITGYVPVQATMALDDVYGRSALTSLALLYAAVAFACLSFAPQFVAKHGPRRSLLASTAVYVAFVVVLALQMPAGVVHVAALVLGVAAAVFWSAAKTQLTSICQHEMLPKGEYAARFHRAYSLGSVAGLASTPMLIPVLTPFGSYLLYAVSIGLGLYSFLRLPHTSSSDSAPLDTAAVRPSIVLALRNTKVLRASLTAFNTWAISALGCIVVLKQLGSSGLGILGVALGAIFYFVSLATAQRFGRHCDDPRFGTVRVIQCAYAAALIALGLLSISSFFALTWMAVLGLVVGMTVLAVAFSALSTAYLSLQMHVSPPDMCEAVSSAFLLLRNMGVVFVLVVASLLPGFLLYMVCMIPLLLSVFWLIGFSENELSPDFT